MDEGPVELGLAGTHAGVEGGRRAGGLAGRAGGGRDGGLEGPPVRALHALALAHVAGVGAPAAARLVQALAAGSVAGAVLRCSRRNTSAFRNTNSLHLACCYASTRKSRALIIQSYKSCD